MMLLKKRRLCQLDLTKPSVHETMVIFGHSTAVHFGSSLHKRSVGNFYLYALKVIHVVAVGS